MYDTYPLSVIIPVQKKKALLFHSLTYMNIDVTVSYKYPTKIFVIEC